MLLLLLYYNSSGIMYLIYFYFSYSGLWEIMLCHTCRSYGTHMICGFLKEHTQIWYCKRCSDNEGMIYQYNIIFLNAMFYDLLDLFIITTHNLSFFFYQKQIT